MLQYRDMPNHAGIVLVGDYQTLQRLHYVLHDVNDRSAIIRNKESFFLSLAYDVRMAFQGSEKVFKPPGDYRQLGTTFGIGVIWPALLVQTRQLRTALSFMDHGKNHQAVAYELEFIVESGLDAQFNASVAEIKSDLSRVDVWSDYVEKNIISRCAQYAAWNKAKRSKGLPGVIKSLDTLYAWHYEYYIRSGAQYLVAPDEYEEWKDREFPIVR